MNVLKNLYTTAGAAIICALLSACATAHVASRSDAATAGRNSSLEAIVDAQLAASNRRDVEGFLCHYSDDAKIFEHPGQLTESGKDQLRIRYKRSFGNQGIRALIVRRIVFDRFVTDHERITGRPQGATEVSAAHEIKDGEIITVTFYKP